MLFCSGDCEHVEAWEASEVSRLDNLRMSGNFLWTAITFSGGVEVPLALAVYF